MSTPFPPAPGTRPARSGAESAVARGLIGGTDCTQLVDCTSVDRDRGDRHGTAQRAQPLPTSSAVSRSLLFETRGWWCPLPTSFERALTLPAGRARRG